MRNGLKTRSSSHNDDQGTGEPGFEAKKLAAPFLKWLEESDEEDEESDSD